MRKFFNLLRSENKPARRQDRARRLSFQDLENRTPMAGDVAVWLDGNTLHIQGDAEANTVQIALDNGKTKVKGLNSIDGLPTSINGSFTTPFFVAAGLKNIEVNLGSGNDIFLMTPNQQNCAGNVNINMGRGADEVVLQSVAVSGNLSITTGLDARGDEILLNNVTAAIITIDTADGDDTIDVRSVVTGSLIVDSQASLRDLDDNIGLVNINAKSVTLNTGTGIDTLGLGFVSTGRLQVDTGAGNDTVHMNDCSADSFFASLGEGDDLLDIHTSAFNQIDLAGQGGSQDELAFTDMIRIGAGPVTGFEIMSNTN